MNAHSLFDWREEADAARAVVAAEIVRAEAVERVRRAPHGEQANRRRALMEATNAALAAEAQLARIRVAGRAP